jgi:hypothetical protein
VDRLTPVTSISADGALCDIAEAEGLAAANPNDRNVGKSV